MIINEKLKTQLLTQGYNFRFCFDDYKPYEVIWY